MCICQVKRFQIISNINKLVNFHMKTVDRAWINLLYVAKTQTSDHESLGKSLSVITEILPRVGEHFSDDNNIVRQYFSKIEEYLKS